MRFRILPALCVLLGTAASAQPSSSGEMAARWVRAALDAMGGETAWRDVGGVRVVAHGYRNLLEQSERPEGPFIPTSFSRTEWLDFDAEALRQDIRGDAFSFSGTVLADSAAAAYLLGERTVPARAAQKTEAEERLALGPERVLLTALDAPDLRASRDTVLQGVPHHVATFGWGRGRVRLLLNARTALPTGVELTRAYPGDVFWGLWGDVTRTTLFSFWALEPGGLRYPHQWDVTWRGLTASVAVVDTVEFGRPDPETLAIPDSVQTAYVVRAQAGIDDLPLGTPTRPPEEVAPGIVVIPGSWYVTLVHQNGSVVVLEAPISSGYSARVIEDAEQRFPGVPVTSVVSTSDAWPHVGGVREYVARGVPIIALDLNVPLLERVVVAHRETAPDRLARFPRAPMIQTISSGTAMGTGPNRMILAPVRGEAGERMVLAYFPEHRLLYASDLIQPGLEDSAWLRGYALDVVDAVAREGWDVDQVFAMHASPMPWTTILTATGR